ncbi:MAG: hypothetical protein IT304_02670, partial [Dehalococcoidia bacterium]|nr:hypothetical protein [Dehalococcoidia bacterium]
AGARAPFSIRILSYRPPVSLDRKERAVVAPDRPYRNLTFRETQILRLIAYERATNARIAMRLGIGEGTVKVHVHHLLAKLRVPNRDEAALLYLRAEGRRGW